MPYNISEAKENIDLILDLAESGRPQIIKRANKEVAVTSRSKNGKECANAIGEYER